MILRFGLHYGKTDFSKLCVLRYILLTIFRKEHCFYSSDFNLSQLYFSLKGRSNKAKTKRAFQLRKALFKILEISRLLIQSLSNVNSTSYCTTYHWVITDTQEAYHFYMSRN